MNFADKIAKIAAGPVYVAPVIREKRTRKVQDNIDWSEIDEKVFRALLHFRFDGCSISKLVDTAHITRASIGSDKKLETNVKRQIIRRSLASLLERGLIKITGHGPDQWIQAANGASMASYFARGEDPIARPDVYRRTTIKPEMSEIIDSVIPVQEIAEDTNQSEDDDYNDDDYNDLDNDLSVE